MMEGLGGMRRRGGNVLVSDLLGILDGGENAVEVGVAVLDTESVPAVGLEAGEDVLGETEVGVTIDGDVVVVVEDDDVAEAEVAGEGGGFSGDALLEAAVAAHGVDGVVEDGEVLLVELGGELLLGDGHTDGVADALAEGTGGNFNTRGHVNLGVAGGAAVELAEVLEVLDGELRGGAGTERHTS